jgi:hypothetical protein
VSLQGEFQRKLYKELVKNYNPLERPVANDSQPLTVYFSLSLLQIMDVVSPGARGRAALSPPRARRDCKSGCVAWSGYPSLAWGKGASSVSNPDPSLLQRD